MKFYISTNVSKMAEGKLCVLLHFIVCSMVFIGCSSNQKTNEEDLVTQTRVSENELIMNCKGRGLDEYRARVDALVECQKAFSVFQNSQIEVNQIQYRSDTSQTNLSLVKVATNMSAKKCEIIKEKIIPGDKLLTLQISCRYRLNDTSDRLPASTTESADSTALTNGPPSDNANQLTDGYQIVKLVSYPKCDNVTVVGKKVRKIECLAASLVIELFPGDNLVVIEKDQFAPVKLSPNDFVGGMKIVRLVQF